jgi:polysaccharide export outer membrane protein
VNLRLGHGFFQGYCRVAGARITLHHSLPGIHHFHKMRFQLLLVVVVASVLGGCHTPQFGDLEAHKLAQAEPIVLHEGDVLRISFPGAPNLNTVQTIRRDGRIALQLVGEFHAAGLTPAALEQELIKLYGPQLQTKEVTVTVESSAFPIYVTGAVLRPGKILSDRPLTALQAIMEAGGFDYNKANLKKVTVIRHDANRTEHFTLDMKGVLKGEQNESFNLKPSDIIYVPERFNWF